MGQHPELGTCRCNSCFDALVRDYEARQEQISRLANIIDQATPALDFLSLGWGYSTTVEGRHTYPDTRARRVLGMIDDLRNS